MKRAYQELANYYDGRALDKSEMLGIAHADNEEGAQALIALLRDKGFTGECLNVVYEPVTGAHVGPGTVALFFYGHGKVNMGNRPKTLPSGGFYGRLCAKGLI